MIRFGTFAALLLLASSTIAQAQNPNWQKEWDDTLAAAKKEGKVVVLGQPSPAMRNVILPRFTQRYGIQVEHVAARSSEITGKLRSERQAGVYSIDVFMSNAGTSYGILYGEKFIDPLKPVLIHPDVANPKNWKGGELPFADPQKQYVLLMFKSVDSFMVVNRSIVKQDDMRSAKDLLNPRWKGKISTEDPVAGGGSGVGSAGHFYTEMGPEFAKQLYIGQNAVVQRDRRQLSDWLARGTHPICLTCHIDDMRSLIKDGFALEEVFELNDMANRLTPAPSLLTMANNAPHPNAAKIFVNWIASKEALQLYSREAQAATLRTDVDESFLDPRVIPKPGVKYVDYTEYDWVVTGRRDVEKKVRDLLK